MHANNQAQKQVVSQQGRLCCKKYVDHAKFCMYDNNLFVNIGFEHSSIDKSIPFLSPPLANA